MKIHTWLILSFLLISSCQVKSSLFRPPLETEGEVYVYLQPLPQEAAKLRFTVSIVSAVREDGMEIPLPIRLSQVRGSDEKRQRLFASGPVPPGQYIGIALTFKDAYLKGEEGEGALLVPKEPARTKFLFQIKMQKAQVLSLQLNYQQSISEGIRFDPVLIATIPRMPPIGVVGYTSNTGSNTVAVFDRKSCEVAAIIPTGAAPMGMALDQRKRRLYVALSGSNAVEVIDTLRQEIINRILLNPGDQPIDLALTQDGRSLLVANSGSNTVSVIDPISFIERGRIAVGNEPRYLLLDRTGQRGYVFNTLSNTLSVIDVPKRAVTATIDTEPGPIRGQFNQQGDQLYVIGTLTPFLIVIDLRSQSVIRRPFIGRDAGAIKVDSITNLIYIGKKNEDMVEIYDPVTLVRNETISTGGGVGYMTIDGEENTLDIILPGKQTVVIVDLVSRKKRVEMDVGEAPYWISLSGERP